MRIPQVPQGTTAKHHWLPRKQACSITETVLSSTCLLGNEQAASLPVPPTHIGMGNGVRL